MDIWVTISIGNYWVGDNGEITEEPKVSELLHITGSSDDSTKIFSLGREMAKLFNKALAKAIAEYIIRYGT